MYARILSSLIAKGEAFNEGLSLEGDSKTRQVFVQNKKKKNKEINEKKEQRQLSFIATNATRLK